MSGSVLVEARIAYPGVNLTESSRRIQVDVPKVAEYIRLDWEIRNLRMGRRKRKLHPA